MNFHFGSSTFSNVKIPILWGTRAVLAHPSGALSIIDVGGEKATPEVVSNTPWDGVEYAEHEDGFIIYRDGDKQYFCSIERKLLRDLKGELPECVITKDEIRIGTNTIGRSMISGFPVGIGVSKDGFFIGGQMPAGLAKLEI